jgi:SPP1 gp7 family putative phage head morphogenesis protein
VNAEREDGLQRTVFHALVMHHVGAVAKPRAISRSTHPMMVELDYGNELASRVRALHAHYAPVVAALPHMQARIARVQSRDRADADVQLYAKELLEQIRKSVRGTLNEAEMEMLARFYGQRVSQRQRTELAKQLRNGLGIDIPIDDSNTPEILRSFSEENAAAITTIPENAHQEIVNLTLRAFRQGWGQDKLASEIADQFDVSEGRARFLARDQVGKLNGQLTSQRHQNLGIDSYYWRTMRDIHVRPKHRRREGKLFSYEDRPPEGGLPGEDYGCRCAAEPNLANVLATIEQQRRFPGRFSAPLAGTLTGRGRRR